MRIILSANNFAVFVILEPIRGITPRHFIRDMANSILGIRSFDEKIDFMRNNKSFVDMTLLKMDFFRQNKIA